MSDLLFDILLENGELISSAFVKTGIFDRETGKALNDAYDKRLVGDYGIGFIVSEAEARDLLANVSG